MGKQCSRFTHISIVQANASLQKAVAVVIKHIVQCSIQNYFVKAVGN